jgi:signal transduction histidine kinase
VSALEPKPRSTILVVDDDARNRRLLRAILTAKGYAVTEAADGEESLLIVADGGVDLVLMDVMMPGIDGIEACRRLRKDHPQGRLPVIFVTALADRDSRVRAKDVGADDFLTKPIDEFEVLVRVRNLLEVKAYHDLRDRQREQLEIELEARSAQLIRAERMASLGTLAAGVGHELNNITMVLLTYLGFVRERAEQGLPPEAEDLEALEHASEKCKTHASQLLSLGRPGTDHAELIDLREVVGDTLAILKSVGKTRIFTVDLVAPGAPVLITVNRRRIEQVITNLVGNAADALLDVSGRERRIRVAIERDEGSARVRCSVRDNGPGIPEDLLATIFEPYYTTKPPGKGTGLGLLVVQQILEPYGSKLVVESRVGEWTMFSFDLPLAAPSGG